MIKIAKAKETRNRDRNRHRFVLNIGNLQFHVGPFEAHSLYKQLAEIFSPKGEIRVLIGQKPPKGWLACNGRKGTPCMKSPYPNTQYVIRK